MVRGLYTGTAAMIANMHDMDVTANNLANVDKTAFKRDQAVYKSFPEMLLSRMDNDGVVVTPLGSTDNPAIIGKLGTGVEINEVFTEHEQGSLVANEDPFNFALTGPGFFTVETPDGLRYTRNGSFERDKEGFLVTHTGDYVLGVQGRIKVQDFNFGVDREGNIFRSDVFGELPAKHVGKDENRWESAVNYNRFQLVDFENVRELKKMGNSYFAESEFSGPATDLALMNHPGKTEVLQSHLENSNVNVVDEMVNMIQLNRTYEANQKSVQSHDQMLQRLVNDVIK